MIENAVTKHEVRGRKATITNGNDAMETCWVSIEVKVEILCFISTTGNMTTGKGVAGVDKSSHENKALIYG